MASFADKFQGRMALVDAKGSVAPVPSRVPVPASGVARHQAPPAGRVFANGDALDMWAAAQAPSSSGSGAARSRGGGSTASSAAPPPSSRRATGSDTAASAYAAGMHDGSYGYRGATNVPSPAAAVQQPDVWPRGGEEGRTHGGVMPGGGGPLYAAAAQSLASPLHEPPVRGDLLRADMGASPPPGSRAHHEYAEAAPASSNMGARREAASYYAPTSAPSLPSARGSAPGNVTASVTVDILRRIAEDAAAGLPYEAANYSPPRVSASAPSAPFASAMSGNSVTAAGRAHALGVLGFGAQSSGALRTSDGLSPEVLAAPHSFGHHATQLRTVPHATLQASREGRVAGVGQDVLLALPSAARHATQLRTVSHSREGRARGADEAPDNATSMLGGSGASPRAPQPVLIPDSVTSGAGSAQPGSGGTSLRLGVSPMASIAPPLSPLTESNAYAHVSRVAAALEGGASGGYEGSRSAGAVAGRRRGGGAQSATGTVPSHATPMSTMSAGAIPSRHGAAAVRAHRGSLPASRRTIFSEPKAPAVVSVKEPQTDEERLAYSRKARQVAYEPHTLEEFRAVRDALGMGAGTDPRTGKAAYYELGSLGPDLASDELVAKRAARERMKNFAASIAAARVASGDVRSGGASELGGGVGEEDSVATTSAPAAKHHRVNVLAEKRSTTHDAKLAAAVAARERALAFAKAVPKPAVKPASTTPLGGGENDLLTPASGSGSEGVLARRRVRDPILAAATPMSASSALGAVADKAATDPWLAMVDSTPAVYEPPSVASPGWSSQPGGDGGMIGYAPTSARGSEYGVGLAGSGGGGGGGGGGGSDTAWLARSSGDAAASIMTAPSFVANLQSLAAHQAALRKNTSMIRKQLMLPAAKDT